MFTKNSSVNYVLLFSMLTVISFPIGLQISRYYEFDVGVGRLYFSDLFFVLGLIMYFYRFCNNNVQYSNKHIFMLFTLYFLLQFASSLHYFGKTTAFSRMCVQYLCFVMICTAHLNYGHILRVFGWMYWFLFFICASVIFEAVFDVIGISIGVSFFGNIEGTIRYVGIVGDTAQASMLALLLGFISYLKIVKENHLVRNVAVFVVALLGLLLTGTRASVVCFTIGMVLIIWMTRKKLQVKIKKALLLIVAGMLALILMFPVLLSGFARFIQDEDELANVRVIPVIQALQTAVQNPWLGVGYGGAFEVLRDSYFGEEYNYVGAFNQYLHVFLEGGIVGLVSYVAFVAAVVFKLIKLSKLFDAFEYVSAFLLWTIILVFVYQTEVWMLPGSRISMVWFFYTGLVLSIERHVVKVAVVCSKQSTVDQVSAL